MGEVVDLFSKTKVSATCLLCRSVRSRIVDTDSWGWYLCTDRFVQDIFDSEDASTREVLVGNKTGAYMCDECRDSFGEE
jgi:hypothetical protein